MGKKQIVAGLVVLVVFALAMAAGLFLGIRGSVLPVSAQRLVPIYKVDTEEKKIAITIDGVWGAEYTPGILELLAEHNITITFFFGGYWLEKYPDMVRRIADGNHEIGNHSFTHPHCSQLSREKFREELRKTSDLVFALTGTRPLFFRPPFGDYSNMVIEVSEEEGMQVIQWSIDSLDWKNPGVDFIVRRIMGHVGPGDIILMHNNGEHTLEALTILIPKLLEANYKIVPLSKLVYRDNYYIERHSGLQRPLQSN